MRCVASDKKAKADAKVAREARKKDTASKLRTDQAAAAEEVLPKLLAPGSEREGWGGMEVRRHGGGNSA